MESVLSMIYMDDGNNHSDDCSNDDVSDDTDGINC